MKSCAGLVSITRGGALPIPGDWGVARRGVSLRVEPA